MALHKAPTFQVPLENQEAEQSVLGAILVRPEVLDEVLELIHANDFYRPAHALIFKAMQELHNRQEPVDLVTVTMRLREWGKLEEVGGPEFLAGLSEQVGFAINAEYYANRVSQKALQRQTKEFAVAISRGIEQGQDVQHLVRRLANLQEERNGSRLRKGYNAAELLETKFSEPVWVVKNLLAEGFNLLSSRMKSGKTIFNTNLAIAQSTGGVFLNHYRLDPAGVLYLDFESPDKQVQKRIIRCLPKDGSHHPDLQNLHIFPMGSWPRMGEGGLRKLRTFLKDHPEVKLVIIDTWGCFQPLRRGKDQFNYFQDYEDVHRIKKVAQDLGVCIFPSHHLNKSWHTLPSPFDAILGSTGVAAAADNLYALTKCNGTADDILWTKGREVEEMRLALRRVKDDFSWNLLGNAEKYELSSEQLEIYEVLQDAGREPGFDGLTLSQIAGAVGKKPDNVNHLLKKLEKKEMVKRVGYGKYRLS